FDLIDSHGVLHHMADPLAGWRALLGVLRPGGIMAIGLYSAIAREHLDHARRLIAERHIPSTTEGIRGFRQQLMDAVDHAPFDGILISDDFYTTSNCRDLLFHVHEDRFS